MTCSALFYRPNHYIICNSVLSQESLCIKARGTCLLTGCTLGIRKAHGILQSCLHRQSRWLTRKEEEEKKTGSKAGKNSACFALSGDLDHHRDICYLVVAVLFASGGPSALERGTRHPLPHHTSLCSVCVCMPAVSMDVKPNN